MSTASSLRQLDAFLNSVDDDAAILRHCLGLEDLPNAPDFAQNMIVIAFDTESWVWDSSKLTEIGFCVFDSRDLRRIKDAGPHGEHLLKGMYWYHIRIQPNAHLINKEKFLEGDPEKNRFGTTRFLTMPEVKGFLTETFGWPVDANRPELGNCPVIVLGHALNNDLPKLHASVGFDHEQLGTVIKTIDTQALAASTGLWQGQPIGLKRLCQMLDFAYRDEHTACNDIGMTVVSAVQMVLPTTCTTDQVKSLQDVVDNLEEHSQNSAWTHGSDTYCLRCNKRGHLRRHCRATIKRCSHCAGSESERRQRTALTHETHKCVQMLKNKARSLRCKV